MWPITTDGVEWCVCLLVRVFGSQASPTKTAKPFAAAD